MPQLPRTLYIEALALVPERKSGVGICLEETLRAVGTSAELKDWQIYLLAPLGKARALQPYVTSPNIRIKRLWLPARAIELLMRLGLLPPVDWFLGRGIYLFPNYRNWPLWRSRSLTYVYDVSFLKHPETGQPKNQRYLSRYIRRWTGRTDAVVTISEVMQREIEQLLDVHYAKLAVVPCGVNRQRFFTRPATDIAAVKQRFGITFKNYILYVGNIEPRKNLLRLLEAYEQLPARLRQTYGLVFVGGGGWSNQEFFDRLQRLQASGANVMKVEDFVPAADLPAIYSGASLLVHPAIYEGFGMTPLEAMACGIPVAVSDIPVMREVVGAAGAYFDPTSAGAMARTLQGLLNDEELYRKLVTSGNQQAALYDWSVSAHQLSEVIGQQWQEGSHRHPLLARVLTAYRIVDRIMLRIFGERALPPYRPALSGNDQKMLRRRIYDDFLTEQPHRWQRLGLRLYLGSRHAAAQVLRPLRRHGGIR